MTPPIHQARSLVAGRNKAAKQTTPMIAITGGKGGVGKTVVAVNLAVLAAQAGFRVLLADLDPGLGNVDVHLRISSRFTIEDVVNETCTLSDAITPAPGGVHVLPGQSASPRLASGDTEFLGSVLDTVERAGRAYDVVICDTGAGIGPGVLETVRRADVALAITTPEPAAVTDAYALCKVLHGIGVPPPQLVFNRTKSRDEAMRTGGRLAAVCEKFLGIKPALAGWIRADTAVEQSTIDQRPCAISAKGDSLEDLRSLTASTLSQIPAPRPRQGKRRAAARRLIVRGA